MGQQMCRVVDDEGNGVSERLTLAYGNHTMQKSHRPYDQFSRVDDNNALSPACGLMRHDSAPSASSYLYIADGASSISGVTLGQHVWDGASESKKDKRQRKKEERRLREETERSQMKRFKRKEEQSLRELMFQAEQTVCERRNVDARILNAFLNKHEFKGLNSKRKAVMFGKYGRKYKYPLHLAVELNDVEMVGILLDFGADRFVRASSKKTPLEKALKLNKNGSHQKIIELMSDLSYTDVDSYLSSRV